MTSLSLIYKSWAECDFSSSSSIWILPSNFNWQQINNYFCMGGLICRLLIIFVILGFLGESLFNVVDNITGKLKHQFMLGLYIISLQCFRKLGAKVQRPFPQVFIRYRVNFWPQIRPQVYLNPASLANCFHDMHFKLESTNSTTSIDTITCA